MSSLFETIASGNLEQVKQCLKSPEGMKELNTFNKEGETTVMVAIKSHQVTIAEALIKAGANMNQGSQEHGTTRGYTAIHFAAKTNDLDSARLLIKQKCDVNRQSADGWVPLHCATFSGHKQMVALLIKEGKPDVNITNEHKITPIFFAASKGSMIMTRELLNAGATLDFVDSMGDTLLHHTFAYQMQKLFEGAYEMPDAALDVGIVLSIWGCDVNRVNIEKKTAFEYVNDDMPAYNDVCKIIYHHREIFKKSPTEWNYMTFNSAGFEHFLGMGLDLKAAVDLAENGKAMEVQRVEAKKEKEAEKPAGGCPVMKSGSRKRRGQKNKVSTEGGAAPDAAEGETKSVDTPHGPMDVPADGSDPSGGQCPFFKPKDGKEAAPTPAPAPAPAAAAPAPVAKQIAPAPAKEQPVAVQQQQVEPAKTEQGQPPSLWALVYENRVAVLLMLIAFFCGIWFEQLVAPMRKRGGMY